MNGKWIVAAVAVALVPAALHVSRQPALAQQAAANEGPQAIIQKAFGPTKQVEVRDPFYNNMVAFTITIPKD